MPRMIEPDAMFPRERPRGLPADTPIPDEEALFARARALASDPTHPLDSLRDILARENRRIGAKDGALGSIDAIRDDTVFVVAGQQAGLFGGPLYTLYKALHAVSLAERIRAEAGVYAIPVFWVASDDHDFDEVRSLAIRTADGTPFTADYEPSDRIDGAPVGEIVLDGGIVTVLDTLAEKLQKGGRTDAYMDMLRQSWSPGVRWADAFSRQMAEMLSHRGLVILDPRWDGVKRLFAHIMRAELTDPLASTALVNDAADHIERDDTKKRALRRPEGFTNLFLEAGGARHPLVFRDGVFGAGGESFTSREIHALLDGEPGRFSPAAALRPVCQDALMPVVALIAGPGERAYLDQMRLLYDLFDINGSIVWPRASFTIIDPRSVRAAEKANIALGDLFTGEDRLRARLTDATFPPEIGDAFGRLESAIESGFEDAASSLASLDPTLAGALHADRGRALHAVEALRGRALRVHKERIGKDMARIVAAAHFLLPDGGPQERRYGADAAYTLLGPDGLDELLRLTSPGEERHRIIISGN